MIFEETRIHLNIYIFSGLLDFLAIPRQDTVLLVLKNLAKNFLARFFLQK